MLRKDRLLGDLADIELVLDRFANDVESAIQSKRLQAEGTLHVHISRLLSSMFWVRHALGKSVATEEDLESHVN